MTGWTDLSDPELTEALRGQIATVTMPDGQTVPVFGPDEDGIERMVAMREHPRIQHMIGLVLRDR